MPNLDLNRSMEEIKKHELLVPKKILKKAKDKYKAKAKDIPPKQLVLSSNPDTQTT